MKANAKYPELRPWNELVGVSSDLADVIVGVLSWTSVSHNIIVVSLDNFYYLFDKLSKEFPDLIQDLHSVTRRYEGGNFLYSTRLCDALEASLQIGIELAPNPQYLYMPLRTCRLNLERLRKRVGDKFVDDLKPLSNILAELINKETSNG